MPFVVGNDHFFFKMRDDKLSIRLPEELKVNLENLAAEPYSTNDIVIAALERGIKAIEREQMELKKELKWKKHP
jgi:predicted DNA-binding protein